MWFLLAGIFILAGFVGGSKMQNNPFYALTMIWLFGIACGLFEIVTRGI